MTSVIVKRIPVFGWLLNNFKLKVVDNSYRRGIVHTVIQSRGSRDLLFNLDESTDLDESTADKRFSVVDSTELWSYVQDLYKLNSRETCLLLRTSQITNKAKDSIIETMEYLRDNDVQKNQLLRIPWIITQNRAALQSKISMLMHREHMFSSIANCLGMCRLSLDEITNIQSVFFHERDRLPCNYRNKVYYIASELMLPVSETTESFSRAPRVFIQPLGKLQSHVEILKKYDVPKESILSDPWVFLQKSDRFVKRLQSAQENKSQNTKPWTFRCSNEVFEKFLIRQKSLQEDEKLLVHYNGCIINLVADYTKTDREIVLQYIYLNHPIYRTRPQKVRDFLLLMLAAGYSTDTIITNLWLVKSSLKTIQHRIGKLKEIDINLTSASILGVTNKRFNIFIIRFSNEEEESFY